MVPRKAAAAAARIALCLAFTSLPAAAEFTFKRIKPGQVEGKYINIHVEPRLAVAPVLSHNPDVPPEAAAIPGRGGPAYSGPPAAEWFWAEVSPDLADAAPARELAVSALLERKHGQSAGLGQSAERLGRIVERYGTEILTSSAGTQISPALILSVIAVESGGNPTAVSTAGAAGLMQLMPPTAARFGVTDRSDPAQNIAGGTRYLQWLLDEFDGDIVLALAGYNAGEGAVQSNRGVPPYAETRLYVPKVMAAWQTARSLCQTPPSRVTEGCIFDGVRIANR